MKVKSEHRTKFSNLSNWKEEAWKKSQGFNGIRTRDLRDTGAMLYQLSYEATHWERGQFIEFISSRAVKWCEVMCCKIVADVSQYVRKNFGPRQSNTFQNGEDNNQVEKKKHNIFWRSRTVFYMSYRCTVTVFVLFSNRAYLVSAFLKQELLTQMKLSGRHAVHQTFTIVKLSQLLTTYRTNLVN